MSNKLNEKNSKKVKKPSNIGITGLFIEKKYGESKIVNPRRKSTREKILKTGILSEYGCPNSNKIISFAKENINNEIKPQIIPSILVPNSRIFSLFCEVS